MFCEEEILNRLHRIGDINILASQLPIPDSTDIVGRPPLHRRPSDTQGQQ